MKQYHPLLRLDTMPFIIVYMVMIALDSGLLFQNNAGIQIQKLTHLVLFPLALLAHVALFLASQWSITIQAKVGYYSYIQQQGHRSSMAMENCDSWTHCLVKPPSPVSYDKDQKSKSAVNNANSAVGRTEIVPVQIKQVKGEDKGKGKGENIGGKVAIISYEEAVFRCCLEAESSPGDDEEMDSIWDINANRSSKLSSAQAVQVAPEIIRIDRHSSSDVDDSNESTRAHFHRLHYPIDLPLSFYTQKWKGHSKQSLKTARNVFSDNSLLINLPPFLDLLTQQLLAPFFLFQLLCVLLWCLDEYWYYALFTLFTLVLFECTMSHSRLKNLQRLRETLRPPFGVWVYRNEKSWKVVSSKELVAGDIISLSAAHSINAGENDAGTRIPADLLLLKGNAVINEAMLTGESVPQMKESIEVVASALYHDNTSQEACLDIEDSTYKRAVIFGGTVLVNHSQSTSGSNSDDGDDQNVSENSIASQIPSSPDDGCLALVLRTGFDTQQGSLLRTMIHTSTKSQSDGVNTKDTFMFIVILLLCAVFSSIYVLKHGWADPTRNRFKLVLHVIIIITSVVPPELPMELSLAVTSSLADLIRRCAVYCTEPFRIPLAGMVDTCCFDKTGTLTSDEMVMRGVRLPVKSSTGVHMSAALVTSGSDEEDETNCTPHEVTRILVGCQSLAPVTYGHGNRNLLNDTSSLIGDPLEKAVLNCVGWKLLSNDTIAPPDPLTSGHLKPVQIFHRFAFTSKLKRMTVIAQDLGGGKEVYALSKGAPEALKALMDPTSIPDSYDSVSNYHMGLGQRVLSLGYKKMTNPSSKLWLKEGRQSVETNLIFAGFLVLDCPLKPDSKKVIKELRNSGHHTVMITGDAIQTAAEVARQVGIIKAKGTVDTFELRETMESQKTPQSDARFVFVPIASNDNEVSSEKCIAYSQSNLSVLKEMLHTSSIAAICVTGDTLTKIALDAVRRKKNKLSTDQSFIDPKTVLLHPDSQSTLQTLVPLISVFARHAPRQKEAVIAAFNGAGRITMMCGDGTNDVGALKMSHCGISIISVPEVEAKQRNAINGLLNLQKEDKGKKSKKKRKREKTKSSKKSWEENVRALAEAEDELNNVALGDASVASPFTSRATSIKCTKDVLQRGRCTLVTMMQIYKILGVNCLVNALVLSNLHLEGAKQGDHQLTVVGLVVAGLFFFVTKGQPLNKLSPERPPSTVLCAQVLVSISVQFAIHFCCIMAITSISKCYLDPFDPSLVPDGHFNPNTLNSATFIMTVLTTVNTFLVNYRGRPFMEDLRENTTMVRALQVCYAVLFTAALEVFPPLNDIIQLSPLPQNGEVMTNLIVSSAFHDLADSIGFKTALTSLMIIDTIMTYLAEKILIKLFQKLSTVQRITGALSVWGILK